MDAVSPAGLNEPNPFLTAARAGRNSLWRYILVSLFAFGLEMVGVGGLALLALIATRTLNPLALPEALLLAVELGGTGFLILALWGGLRLLHGRRLASLLHPAGPFRWDRLACSAAVWLALSALGDVTLALLYPGSYALAFSAQRFWPYAVMALLLLPVQVASEELFFRGYLTQGFGLAGGGWLAWLAPALLFGLLHSFNPEVASYGALYTLPIYIGMGLILGWVTLRSAGLELALGMHLANNLYGTLLVTAPVSALPSPAILQIQTYHPPAVLGVFLISAALYVLVLTPRNGVKKHKEEYSHG